MIRTTIASAAALLLAASPAAAQDAQEKLDARYDRALAAGYKALMLCSAIGNAELFGARRSAESVERYELSGIYPKLDPILADLTATIERGADGVIDHVTVPFAQDMPPRIALHIPDKGCIDLPVGSAVPGGLDRFEPSTEIDRSDEFDGVAATRGEALARTAFDPVYGEGARTTAAVVLQRGELASEAYGPDHGPRVPQRTWSVAKSIAATIIGGFQQGGLINTADSAGLGEADDDPRRAITVDHLLRMASGRYSDTPGNRTDPLYFGGSLVAETAAHWPLIHPPGTVYRYANNDTLMAIGALASFRDQPGFDAFFPALGMNSTIAERDAEGDYILSSQVWSTARDLARLGQLHLDGGVLPSGERILPEGWTDYVSSPAGPQPEGRPFGYGAGWWLLNASKGVPPDTYAAMGNRGQFVVVVPSRDVVIVRRGEDPAGQGGFDIAAFTRDVLAALQD